MPVWVPSHTPSWKQGFARYGHLSAAPGLWKRLVGLWVPSLGPTGLTLRDLSGFGNHGTLTNMDPAADWVTTGQRGIPWALDFDGSNQSVYAPLAKAVTYPFTMSGIVDISSASAELAFSVGDSGGTLYAGLRVDNNARLIIARPGQVGANNTVAPGIHHVVIVFHAANLAELYADGVLLGTETDVASAATFNRAAVGVSADSTPFGFYTGPIGNVSLWDQALAPSEIQQLHADPMAMFRRRIQIFPAAVAAAVGNRKHYVLGGGIVA